MNKISNQERVDFVKNLAVMLKSGIVINEALGTLSSQVKSKIFKNIISEIKNEVERGTSLAEAFEKKKKIFGNIFISLIKVGESSGTLEENLLFLSDWLERSNDLKKQISAVTLYPKIVLVATIVLGGGLAVFVLPRLVPLFTSLRVKLPLATRILLAVSIFVQKFWLLTIFGIAGIIVFFILINKIYFVRRFFDAFYLKIPFFGDIIIDYQLALISQIFSTLFKSGISINEALLIVSEGATNIYYQESILKMKERVVQGVALSEAMRQYPKIYPENLINIVAVGEKSGNLEKSFFYLAEFYSKEVNNKVKRLPTVIEPLLLILIGLIVGFVALSIIAPIYELTRGFSQ